MQKIAIIVGILAASLFSDAGHANSYDHGIKLYRRADFKGAERAFLNVLRGGANRATKGRVYKYIGLCQYMVGRKSEARTSFHSALKYDPKTEIYPDEALDSSVLEFFLQIKQDRKKGIGVVANPSPTSKSYPSHGKAVISKQATPKAAPKPAPRRTTAAKIAPKPAIKKPPGKRTSATKQIRDRKRSAKSSQQAVRKKTKKDSLFKDKKKKAPRVIFRDKNDGSEQRGQSLLLPPGAGRDSSHYDSKSYLWHFLPFGIGQYMNDNYKLGHAFAATGVLTLGSFIFYMYTTYTEQKVLDDFYTDMNSDRKRYTPNSNYVDHFKKWDELIAEWENYVSSLRLYSYTSLALFAAVYAGGVVEAIVNRPTAQRYSLLVPKVHYGYNYQGHQFALLWQYQLP